MSESEVTSPLAEIRRTKLDTYANNPQRISQDFKLEAADSADYSRRFIFELLQNADDEMPAKSATDAKRRIRLELRQNCLLVANTGRAFDVDDLEAITTLTQTTKGGDGDEATIGHKGRGFTSVLDVTDHPAVYSRSAGARIAAEFDRDRTRTAIVRRLEREGIDPSDKVENVPLMPLPFPAEASDAVEGLLEGDFTTVFRLPFTGDDPERTREIIASTLERKVTRETVALLPRTDRIEIVIGDRERTWHVDRDSWRGDVDATLVRTHYTGTLDERTPEETEETYVTFERERSIPDRSFVGIEESILEDIGRLRTSVAFELEDDEEGTKLRPLHVGRDDEQRPFIHVFLPTEERSPIPVLLNGTFQVSTSRRSLNMPTDPDTDEVVGLNGWLFRQVANIIAEDVLEFVRESETSVAEFLRTIDFTAVLDDDTAASDPVNRCLIGALREAFAGVTFVPRLDQLASGEQIEDPDPQPLEEVVVPYTHPDKETLGELVGMIYGRGRVAHGAPESSGYFPHRSLLAPDVAPILAALGAAELDPSDLPPVLGAADDSNAVLQNRDAEDELTIDPIVHALAQTWQTLTDDQQKERFAVKCRSNEVFPVGDRKSGPAGPYYRHEAKPEDVEFFFPPERTVPSDALSGIRLLPRTLYYVDGSRQESARARERVLEGGEFQSVLESVWDVNEFAFQEVAEQAIFPLLPGPGSGNVDDSPLRDLAVIRFIQRLACSSTSGRRAVSPDAPLPYEYRNAEPYYDLCLLALPTSEGDWARAHELYFGSTWQRGRPEAARVESLLDSASVEAPTLAPPERFGVDPEDETALEEWREFFRWVGVAEHVRVTPFFSPTRSHRYKSTERIRVAEGSTVDPGSSYSPTGIPEEDLTEYLEDIRDRAHDAADEDEGERPFIWQINGLEFGYELVRKAESDPEFGTMLLRHLHAWWSRLSRHADATVALYSNKRLRGRTTYLFKDDEKTDLGPNLWLWQLRRTPWLPTALGTTSPENAWLLDDQNLQRFSVDVDGARYPLLPVLVDDAVREALNDTSELREALSIRRALSRETVTPDDVRCFTETLDEKVRELTRESDRELRDYLPEIRAAYGHLADELPGLDSQGNIVADDWRPSITDLREVPVPCWDDGAVRFRPAKSAFFVRSHDEADRYDELDVPTFVLMREETARVGAHLGMTDLRAAVSETPSVDEECLDATQRLRESWLEPAAPYVLCRLKATRSSQEMLRRDADGLTQFIGAIRLVGDLEIEYELETDDGVTSTTRPVEYFIERDEQGNRSTVYVTTAADDPVAEPPTKTLAKALCEFRELPSWEAIFVLLRRAPDHGSMREQLRDAGAPSSEQELRERRSALDDVQDRSDGSPEIQIATGDESGLDTITSSTVPSDDADDDTNVGQDATERSSADRSSTVRDGSSIPDIDQLERIGERKIVASSPDRSSRHERADHDERSRTGQSGTRSGGSSGSGSVTAEYIDRVDEFGMKVTRQAELERLREEGCDDPERYVHDIHTRDLYEEAREHEIAGPVLRDLEDRGVISKPYPGFDFLVVARDGSSPERCIELKSSGTNTRRPSISWNEWKSARNEDLRETYYLYVATQLEEGKSGDARLVQIPDPFATLDSRERTTRSQNREVQVKLSEFNPEAGEVVERPIYWRE